MGLWPGLAEQRRANCLAACLPRLLQRPQATLGIGLQTPSFAPRREQPIATQQLVDRYFYHLMLSQTVHVESHVIMFPVKAGHSLKPEQ